MKNNKITLTVTTILMVIQSTDTRMRTVPRFYYSVTRDTASGTIYVKLVNPTEAPLPVHLKISGVTSIEPAGQLGEVKGTNPADLNTITDREHIVPTLSKVDGLSTDFTRTFAPYSANVAGELKSAEEHGVCSGFNTNILVHPPEVLPSSYIISSKGVKGTTDQFHFSTPGMREFGKRYAQQMLKLEGFKFKESERPGLIGEATTPSETNAPAAWLR
jgi:hypothetical protein